MKYWILSTKYKDDPELIHEAYFNDQLMIKKILSQGSDITFRVIPCVEASNSHKAVTHDQLKSVLQSLEPSKPWDKDDEKTLSHIWGKL